MDRKIKIAIAGLGNRGLDTYAMMVKQMPEKAEIVAVADTDPEKVAKAAEEFRIPEDRQFASAEEMLAQDKLADAMVIATQDRQHVGHAIPALKKGYDLLLEKPISPDLDECREILKTADECGRKVVVCHVLRYTPFFRKLKEIIDSGAVGDIVSVIGAENVGYWHQAHSFVRGNWRNSDETSPMILQKCCHDMDYLLWLTGKTCESVSSYGSTYLFKKENQPEGAADYCLGDCKVKAECPFDAEKIYMDDPKRGIRSGNTDWPVNVLDIHPTEESIYEAIKSGPYGRCVYACDNNVVDHQVVNMKMTDGATISFTMCGFTNLCTRYERFMGTRGEILAEMDKKLITVEPFGKEKVVYDLSLDEEDMKGHGGGDKRIVETFIDLLLNGKAMTNEITSLEQSVESHYCALAAEESRVNGGKAVDLSEYRG